MHTAFDDFRVFYAELGPRPSAEHSLDRIDNSRGYEPGNIRWATRSEQAKNRERQGNPKLTLLQHILICGDRRPAKEFAALYGVHPETIRRIRRRAHISPGIRGTSRTGS